MNKKLENLVKVCFLVLAISIFSTGCKFISNNVVNEQKATSQNQLVTITPNSIESESVVPTTIDTDIPIPINTIETYDHVFELNDFENKILVITTSNSIKFYELSTMTLIKEVENFTTGELYFSPNGRYVAYQDYRNGDTEIYITDLITFEESLIISNDESESIVIRLYMNSKQISWSPDSSMIAFEWVYGEDKEILVYTLANQTFQNISNSYLGYDFGPSFSPDGNSILFVSDRTGFPQIYIVSPDGSEMTPLTNFSKTTQINFPTWSPDGKRISFTVVPDSIELYQTTTPDIFVISSDGTETRQLTKGEDYFCHLCYQTLWTPDSQALLFTSLNGSAYDVFSVSVDSQEVQQLTFDDNINQGAVGWISEDLILFVESEPYPERLCVSEIYDWKCEEILDISNEDLIIQYDIIELSN